jgi:hypothetical protein
MQRKRNYRPSTCIGVCARQEVINIPLSSVVCVKGSSNIVWICLNPFALACRKIGNCCISVMALGLVIAIVMPKPTSCAVLEESGMDRPGPGMLLSELQYEIRCIELSKLLIVELVQVILSKQGAILLNITRIRLHKRSSSDVNRQLSIKIGLRVHRWIHERGGHTL